MPMKALKTFAVLGLALAAPAFAQAPIPPDIGGKVLPSFVLLSVQSGDGRTILGTGFLTVKDGLLATAWPLVAQGRGAVARFSNGEEFECSGIVDKDAKRNVALVRIKAFGRPVLKMEPVDLPAGNPVAVPAVKDGAFGLVAAVIGETSVIDGVKWVRLAGDVPDTGNGAPVVDAAGSVVGIVVMKEEDGKPAPFAVPAAYLLGLDASLPTQPWGAAPAAAAAANLAPLDEIDARIGRALMAVTEDSACLAWAGEITRGYGFLNGVPEVVYQMQQSLDTAMAALSEVRTDDALRLRLGRAIVPILANQKASSESFIRAVVIGQQAKSWDAQSQDAQKRSNSLTQSVSTQIAGLVEDLKALEDGSAKFREFLTFEQRYVLGLAERPSGFRLGVNTYPRNPFLLLVVGADSLAKKMGLRPGDLVVSAGGRTFTAADDFEEFKLLIKANLGRKLEAVVERNGKTQAVTLKIPNEIPADALYVR